MKLSHLEMLKKIKAHIDGRVSLTDVEVAWQVREWEPLTHEETEVLSEAPSPEEAIEAAYKKLFPPIPKRVDSWFWNATGRAWMCSGAVTVRLGERGYRLFVLGEDDYSGAVKLQELKDLTKLIEINPELKPPTEE